VLVAEAGEEVGGSSRLSGGMIMAAGTSIQQANGIEDDWQALLQDYLQFSAWKVEPSLAAVLARGSAEAVEWLIELGVPFARSTMIGGEETVARSHLPRGSGQSVIDVLARSLRDKNVDIALSRRVERLLTSATDDRVVTGVAVGDDELHASAVVLATGGFGANPEKVQRYLPVAMTVPERTWYIGSDASQGDAIDLATSVGADLAGQGRGLVLLTPGFTNELESYLPGWLLLVDHRGQRFVNETLASGVLQGIVQDHGGRVFAIFDETARLAASPDTHGEYRGRLPGGRPWPQSPFFNSRTIEQQVARGTVMTGTTVEELAQKTNLPVHALERSISRYNELVESGRDDDHRKAERFLRPVTTPPFYAVDVSLSTIALTASGLRIDSSAHVLDEAGEPIPGLYAAGECTGGVIGDRYMGNGNSWANCLSFGRVAGRSAAKHALGTA
jgi:fumarate reductase flavoprotein subunit